MKLFGASLNQKLNLRIGVFSKRKSNLILARRDIQRLKNRKSKLWNHPVCLTKHSEWGRRVDTLKNHWILLSPTYTNCSSNRQDHVWDADKSLTVLGMNFKLAESWHWGNKCRCMSDHWKCWRILVWSINAARLR